jgi:hypothetical protein
MTYRQTATATMGWGSSVPPECATLDLCRWVEGEDHCGRCRSSERRRARCWGERKRGGMGEESWVGEVGGADGVFGYLYRVGMAMYWHRYGGCHCHTRVLEFQRIGAIPVAEARTSVFFEGHTSVLCHDDREQEIR